MSRMVKERWTEWAEELYFKTGPRPSWRAFFVWVVDEVFWRFRLVAGDPDYADDFNCGKYWEDSWMNSWVLRYINYDPFPKKW